LVNGTETSVQGLLFRGSRKGDGATSRGGVKISVGLSR
jgi:hypothetical protein